MVLDLIIQDEGGNSKVETKRGRLFHAPEAKAENLEDKNGQDITEAQEIVILRWRDKVNIMIHQFGFSL